MPISSNLKLKPWSWLVLLEKSLNFHMKSKRLTVCTCRLVGLFCPIKNVSHFTEIVVTFAFVLYRFTRSCIRSNTMKPSFRALSTSKCCRKWDYPSQIIQKMATPAVWMRVGYQLMGTSLYNLKINFFTCINGLLHCFCNDKWGRYYW